MNLEVLSRTDDPNSATNTFIAIAVVAGIGLSVWAIKKALRTQRTEALKTAAQEIGFTFEGQDWVDTSRAPRLETALFDQGRGGEIENILTGSHARLRASIFDFSFTVGTGKGSHTVTQTVGAFAKEGVYLPRFELRSSGTLDRVWDAIAHKNIHFDSSPEFTRRYLLRSPSEDEIRALFTPGLLSFLEQINPEEKWAIEGEGDTLILYHPKWRIAPAEIREFVDRASSIACSFFSLGNCPVDKGMR